MLKFISWSLLFTQLVAVAHAAPNDTNYGAVASFGRLESCPSPLDIKNKTGIFTSSGKNSAVQWLGVLADSEFDYVTTFEKGIFFLTQNSPKNIGLIKGCIYKTMSGKYLSMQLDTGKDYRQVMWVGRSLSWIESRDFSLPTILECTDKFKDACHFYLEPSEHTASAN